MESTYSAVYDVAILWKNAIGSNGYVTEALVTESRSVERDLEVTGRMWFKLEFRWHSLFYRTIIAKYF